MPTVHAYYFLTCSLINCMPACLHTHMHTGHSSLRTCTIYNMHVQCTLYIVHTYEHAHLLTCMHADLHNHYHTCTTYIHQTETGKYFQQQKSDLDRMEFIFNVSIARTTTMWTHCSPHSKYNEKAFANYSSEVHPRGRHHSFLNIQGVIILPANSFFLLGHRYIGLSGIARCVGRS
jgi:hypothetical protein